MKKRFLLLFIALVFLTGSIFSYLYAEAASPKSDELTALARNFVALLVKGDFKTAEKSFDATMASQVPVEKLQETWETIVKQVGNVKKEVKNGMQQTGEYDIVILTYEFEKMALDIRIVFNSSRQVSGLFFAPAAPVVVYKAPEYVKTSAFTETEVTVGAGEWALPGTLTIPKNGKGPFSVVVLVHGSGPNDRDETIGPNKPFKDLAWGLATQNIAVLRFEKRTRQYAEKLATTTEMTVKEEVVDDVVAAVNMLRKNKQINAAKIFVLGHSLGGMLAPRIAKADPKIAGFIVLAGSTRPLEDEIYEQYVYLLSLNPTEDGKKAIAQIKKQVDAVKDPNLSEKTPHTQLPLGIPAKYWLDLRGYNPAQMAVGLKQPFLILHGERDYQVTTSDFDGWKKALAVRKNVGFKLYPKLNHLFTEGEGKSTPAEYNKESHIPAEVINDIASWVTKQK